MKSRRAILLCLLLGALMGGCQPLMLGTRPQPKGLPSGVAVFTGSERLSEFSPATSDPSALTPKREAVFLSSARNETTAFQALFSANRSQTRYTFTPSELQMDGGLETTLPASAITLYRELPVQIDSFPAWQIRQTAAALRAGKWFDKLSAIDGPVHVATDNRLAIWCDVRVPASAKAGIYRGSIRVDMRPGKTVYLPIRLRVWAATLPATPTILCLGQFDHAQLFRHFLGRVPTAIPAAGTLRRSDIHAVRDAIQAFCRTAKSHGLSVFDQGLRPKLAPDKTTLSATFDRFDALVGPLLTPKNDPHALMAWPVSVTTTWPDVKPFGSAAAPGYAKAMGAIVRASNRHFHLAGIQDRLFAFPAPTPADQTNFASLASHLQAADRDLPILSLTPPADATHWKYIHMLAPPAEQFSPQLATRLAPSISPLAGLYLRPSNPPFLPPIHPLAQGGDVRALCWFTKKYNARGILLGNVVAPPAATPQLDTLFYLDGHGATARICPSVSLKFLRTGMADLAYLRLLERSKRADLVRSILNTMTRFAGSAAASATPHVPRLGGWVRRAALWQRIRLVLAESATKTGKPQTPQQHQADLKLWRQICDALCEIDVEQVHTRILPATVNSPSKATRVEVAVTLFNQYPTEQACLLSLANLPKSARPLSKNTPVSNIAPLERRTVHLAFELDTLPITSEGKIPFGIQLQQPLGKTTVHATSAAVLIAKTAHRKPTIDGKLNDWLAVPANTAGGFVLLGNRGRTARPQAQNATTVQVLQDQTHLYFAFRCNHPTPNHLRHKPTNRLHYQQLLAVGEECVELLLDPGCDAKAPEDLYHIAIKPSGVVLEELGIGTTPPLGRHRRLPLSSTVAISRTPTAWIAELRIPKSAFGVDGKQTRWGINLMRHCTPSHEASSWVRATHHLYHPTNLGTLFVFPPPKR